MWSLEAVIKRVTAGNPRLKAVSFNVEWRPVAGRDMVDFHVYDKPGHCIGAATMTGQELHCGDIAQRLERFICSCLGVQANLEAEKDVKQLADGATTELRGVAAGEDDRAERFRHAIAHIDELGPRRVLDEFAPLGIEEANRLVRELNRLAAVPALGRAIAIGTPAGVRDNRGAWRQLVEGGPGIAALFPEPLPPVAAADFNPLYCKHCCHARGCMCPRDGTGKRPAEPEPEAKPPRREPRIVL